MGVTCFESVNFFSTLNKASVLETSGIPYRICTIHEIANDGDCLKLYVYDPYTQVKNVLLWERMNIFCLNRCGYFFPLYKTGKYITFDPPFLVTK